jgi:glycosyltransferase involved in cell wall biosynthesis
MSTLSIATICQDEEEPIKWYLEACKHTFNVMQDKLKEIVIVDGGSKDNTIDIIKEYQKEIPVIKLIERPWDYTAAQMNHGLEHCTGDYVFTPDADMTWSANLPNVFLTGYFDRSIYWDFLLIFTARDAYHYFKKWPIGPNIRMHKRGLKWTRKYHVSLEGQHPGIPVAENIIVFENSCRIKNDDALRWRGERRQGCLVDMAAEGASPGPPDRFYGAAHCSDDEIGLISDYNRTIASLILPNTNG